MIWCHGYQSIDERKLLGDREFKRPTIITNINGIIIAVNLQWEKMCKFNATESFGLTPKILQGPLTNLETAQMLSNSLRAGKKIRCSLINYTKKKEVFVNRIIGWQLGDIFIAETYDEEFINDESIKNMIEQTIEIDI
tara:strand:+ start:4184 stop:4597 length:414 start_codon:yes stop_codon:yes gene_type:complete